MTFADLEQRLEYHFGDPALLRRAMCHRSWVAETEGELSNERLEFLGDAVLGWVIADIVFHRFADREEGALTDLRKSVVNAVALADVASELGIGEHLLLGKGESAAGGREKVSILSDAMEAVLGAIYIDGGSEQVAAAVERLFLQRLHRSVATLHRFDQKSALQEFVSAHHLPSPAYRISATGPDHERTFVAEVVIAARIIGSGIGRSKKAAEQLAAEQALTVLLDESER